MARTQRTARVKGRGRYAVRQSMPWRERHRYHAVGVAACPLCNPDATPVGDDRIDETFGDMAGRAVAGVISWAAIFGLAAAAGGATLAVAALWAMVTS